MTENMSQTVFELKGKGLSQRKIAEQLGIKRSLVRKILENPDSASPKTSPTQPPMGVPTHPTGQPTHPTSSTNQPTITTNQLQ